MAIDYRSGTKVIKNLRREEASASRVEPYPYIGIVKSNLDPTRSGRLQVWIPDLGGDADDPLNWRTISYASPYMGYTTHQQSTTDPVNYNNTFEGVTHTYGMWMVPPDIGVHVIVLFMGGDPLRGYWLACVNPNLSHHMLPGLAGSDNIDKNTDTITGTVAPVVEFNENIESNVTNPYFYNLPKPTHKIQYSILKKQGLDRDSVRGSNSSSSQRETPSNVFGISTPGRPYPNDPADDVNFVSKLNAGTLTPEYFKVTSRKGGHTFVMDDGSTLGADQLIRLRTAGGHQLLMHDTASSIYLSHASGDSWIEMTNTGQIKIYTKGSFNVRAEGTMNFHTEGNMNFQAETGIKFKTGGAFKIESTSTTLLTGSLVTETIGKTEFKVGSNFNVQTDAGVSFKVATKHVIEAASILQNSGGSVEVKAVPPMKTNNFTGAVLDQSLGIWVNKPNLIQSIVTVAPTHEPYPRVRPAQQAAADSADLGISGTGAKPKATFSGTTDATKNVAGTGVTNPVTDKSIRNQPIPKNTIGPLSKDQLQAYYAQMGQSESGGNYAAVNSLGFVGKYQFGVEALKDQGYIKSDVKNLSELDNPNSWVGKNGITSKDSWLNSKSEQEAAMEIYTKKNYDAMVQNGAITADMAPEEVSGMLATAALLGANGAKTWRNGGGGADAYGTTGDTYFQKGKYAVSVAAPKVASINGG